MSTSINKPRIKIFLLLLVVTVVLAGAMGLVVNRVFGKKQEEQMINAFMPDELELGDSFTLDELVEYMQYDPLWIKSNEIDVQLFAEEQTEEGAVLKETNDLLDYSTKDRIFYVNGVGAGMIHIYSKIDKTVVLQLPFVTQFQSPNTEAILRENYPQLYNDNIITNTELQFITELTLPTSNSVDLTDFASCSSLKRIILTTSNDIVYIAGIELLDQGVQFLVYNKFYDEYINDAEWAAYYERLFPIVNLEENKNAIVFEFNGGVMAKAGKGDTHYFDSVSKGATVTLADYAIQKMGYTFLGWYLSSDKGNTLTTKVTDDYVFEGNTKLYANWVANEYDVCYNDNFVVDLPDMQHAVYSEQFSLSNFVPKRTGYTFLGWAVQENSNDIAYLPGASVKNLSSVDKDVVNLYGVWAANSYSIKYHANGGSNTPSVQSNLVYGEEVQLSSKEPQRNGYTFLGWSTNQNDIDFEYAAGATVKNLVSDAEGVVTFYAIWAANNYSIKYDANGGSNAPVEQNDLKYGATITLSIDEPQRTGHVFLGWSAAIDAVEPSYLPGASVKNLVSTLGGEVTLYAVWELDTFYLKYDPNGGSGDPDDEILTYNTAASVSTVVPILEGHSFLGWATEIDGVVEYANGETLDMEDVNRLYSNGQTLYAMWEVLYYTISVTSSGEKGGSVTGIINGQSYQYGSWISISANYVGDENRWMKVNGSLVSNSYGFSMPATDVSIEVHSDQSCIAARSMITLADGSQKKVEDLAETDMLLVFDHEMGEYVSAPILFIENDGWREYDVINLVFSNGQTTKIIDEHAFFDFNLNKYVYIDDLNYTQYVGHEFALYGTDNNTVSRVVLENAYSQVEYTGCYSLVTAYHMNYFVDGLFSMPGGINGLFNIFEYDDNMCYDAEKMQADINTYGLYTYEDFAQYVPYEVFEYMFPAKYFKVAVGKSMITYEEIIGLIEHYLVKHGFI